MNKLHEAIKAVLMNYGNCTPEKAAEYVNKHSLFESKAQTPVTSRSIKTSASRYPAVFGVQKDLIYLKSFGLEHLSNIIKYCSKAMQRSKLSQSSLQKDLLPALAILLKYGRKNTFITDYSIVDFDDKNEAANILSKDQITKLAMAF